MVVRSCIIFNENFSDERGSAKFCQKCCCTEHTSESAFPRCLSLHPKHLFWGQMLKLLFCFRKPPRFFGQVAQANNPPGTAKGVLPLILSLPLFSLTWNPPHPSELKTKRISFGKRKPSLYSLCCSFKPVVLKVKQHITINERAC